MSDSRPIGVAVIGAGHWGPNLIRNFHDADESEVRWIIDRDADRCRAVAERYPRSRVSGDVAHALGDPDVDAVVVSTPTVTHFELARAALQAGKHVLVEKPIATSAAEAEELCALADERGRVLMVGHVFLYNASVRHVKERLDREELGRIHYIAMTRTNLGPVRSDVNAAWDLAAHDLSIVGLWLGAEPLTVSAVGGAWLQPGIEDAVFATLRYPGDVLVNLHSSWLNPRKARDITIVGERRMLTFDDMSLSEPVRIYDKHVVSEDPPDPAVVDTFVGFRASVREGAITIPRVPLGEPLREECKHFLRCIATGATPVSDGRDGLSVVRALEAIARSVAAGGREETVQP